MASGPIYIQIDDIDKALKAVKEIENVVKEVPEFLGLKRPLHWNLRSIIRH